MGATPSIIGIDLAVSAAGFKLRGVRGNVGAVVVRKILNSSSWSQHSYGNATDYYGPADELERLYWFLKANPVARTVCYDGKGGCTSPHTDHLHVDARPKFSGDPTGGGTADKTFDSGGKARGKNPAADPNQKNPGISDKAVFDLFSSDLTGPIRADVALVVRAGRILAGAILLILGLSKLFSVMAPKQAQTLAKGIDSITAVATKGVVS